MKNLRFVSFILLSIGLLAGLACSSLFSGCDHSQPSAIPAATSANTVDLRAELTAQQASYQAQLDSVAKSNTALTHQTKSSRSALQAARLKSADLEGQLSAVFWQITADTNQCPLADSLNTSLKNYMAQVEIKDSLCDDLASSLQAQVSNRDSACTLQSERAESLQFAYGRLESSQSALALHEAYYRRQYKRQKLKSRLLSAAVLMLAGTATYSILHY